MDLHHANTKHNIPFQSVALDNDDNINNHTNPNSGTMSSVTFNESTWTYFTCFICRFVSRRFVGSGQRSERLACWQALWSLPVFFCQKTLRCSREFCGSLLISQKVKNGFPLCLVAKDKYCLLKPWINRHLDFNGPLLKERGKITQKWLWQKRVRRVT